MAEIQRTNFSISVCQTQCGLVRARLVHIRLELVFAILMVFVSSTMLPLNSCGEWNDSDAAFILELFCLNPSEYPQEHAPINILIL